MKIVLFGSGKMGQLIASLIEKRGHSLVACFDRTSPPTLGLVKGCDVCIDFSHASCVLDHLDMALTAEKPIVIGTTGWDEYLDLAQKRVSESATAAVYSPNFSLGIALFVSLLSTASELFSPHEAYESTCVEYHHRQKKDIPSGTAKAIREVFGGTLPIHSVRCGHMPGTHSVIFDSEVDTITLTHTARSREGFANGALQAAEWILNKKGWWTFHDLVRTLYTPNHSL